jgi:protein AroM
MERPGVEIAAEALIPSASPAEAEMAARRLAAHDPDLVAMDYELHAGDSRGAAPDR